MEAEALYSMAGGAGIVLALVGVLRQALKVSDRFAPLLAIALGIGWQLGGKASELLDASWAVAAISGVIVGLTASGLHSGGRALAGR